jgi:defect in organelle trafficking protein DotD
MRVLKGAGLGLGVILSVGCTTAPPHAPPPTSGTEYVSRVMADSVAVAANAQAAFEEVLAENSRTLSLKQKAIDTDQVDVDYIGKPQELLQTLSYRYGYGYVETGKREDLRIINVRMTKTAPVEILRSVGYQISYGAKVVLDKRTKQVRLIYRDIAPPQLPVPSQTANAGYSTPATSANSAHGRRNTSYTQGGRQP